MSLLHPYPSHSRSLMLCLQNIYTFSKEDMPYF